MQVPPELPDGLDHGVHLVLLDIADRLSRRVAGCPYACLPGLLLRHRRIKAYADIMQVRLGRVA